MILFSLSHYVITRRLNSFCFFFFFFFEPFWNNKKLLSLATRGDRARGRERKKLIRILKGRKIANIITGILTTINILLGPKYAHIHACIQKVHGKFAESSSIRGSSWTWTSSLFTSGYKARCFGFLFITSYLFVLLKPKKSAYIQEGARNICIICKSEWLNGLSHIISLSVWAIGGPDW